jgi:hypothetical protein
VEQRTAVTGRVIEGRVRLVSTTTLFAGGDSAIKEGFACTLLPRPRLVLRVMTLLGRTIDGLWRWAVFTGRWEPGGTAVHRVRRRTFVRHGPPRAGIPLPVLAVAARPAPPRATRADPRCPFEAQ